MKHSLNIGGPVGITDFDHEYRLSGTQTEAVI